MDTDDDPRTRAATRNGPVEGPFCQDLASKKRYFLRSEPRTEADLLDASGHCWCRRTMTAIGPDGDLVDPVDCRRGRACFASVLVDPS